MMERSGVNIRVMAAAMLLVGSLTAPVTGGNVLDQSYTAGRSGLGGGYGNLDYAQTFTAGVKGFLSQLDLNIAGLIYQSDFNLEIHQTINGVPTDPVLVAV